MFQAAHRRSSGAPNCTCSLWFIYTCGGRSLSSLSATQPGQQPVTTCVYKPGLQVQFEAPDGERYAARNMLSLQ